jgi:hypothetical protein
MCLVHKLTWTRFPVDAKACLADSKGAAARLRQIYSGQNKIGPAGRGTQRCAHTIEHLSPANAIEQRDLPSTALVRVALNSAANHQSGSSRRIHGPAMPSFYPDLLEVTHDLTHIMASAAHESAPVMRSKTS